MVINLPSTVTARMLDENFVIRVPAHILATVGAKPSADTVDYNVLHVLEFFSVVGDPSSTIKHDGVI